MSRVAGTDLDLDLASNGTPDSAWRVMLCSRSDKDDYLAALIASLKQYEGMCAALLCDIFSRPGMGDCCLGPASKQACVS